MSDKERQEKSIFLEAIDIASAEDRAAYLQSACAGNDALRHEIDSLLRAHAKPQRLLDAPDLGSPTLAQPISEKPGAQIGPYRLLQEVGQGGMGVVYLAEQHKPVRRQVAIKIIKPGMDTRQVIARFEAERQALSLMDHPNIARVLDAGTTETGRPYFVMEMVKGVPITQYCDEKQLTPTERLQLFVPVCQAVQHAHQKGIIHRDIKPSNVMVALYDDRPVPKIIDFGVAKAMSQQLAEDTIFTQCGQVVGTIEYMSPEQANLERLDVDTRSDVYSLGVLLYELLTGETPFDRKRLRSAAFDELMRILREEEPPRPSDRLSTSDTLPSIAANRRIEPKKLGTLIRGDLDWIVMKAIEKDRTRRYETANGLAMDIQRYLDVEPVVACPPSFGYRLRKTLRRHRTATAVVAGFVVLLVTGAATSTYFALQASARAQEAEANAAASARNASHARKNLGKARAAVDRLLSRVATTRLGDNPQTVNLKLQLLEDTTQFHEEFMQGADHDPFLRREAAVSRAQLAWAHYLLGRRDEAETHIRRAVTMLEAVVRDDPRDHHAGWSLAKRRVEFYWYLRDAGDRAGAEEQIRGSVTLAERLYQDSPADAQAEILVTARIHMVEFLTNTNQLEEAETWARKAVQLAQQDEAVTTYTRGSALQYLGQTLEKRNPAEAEAIYEEARLTFEECIRRNEEVQASLEGRDDLIWVLRSQSRLASQAGNQKRAYELLIAARGLVERLAHDYPQFPWYGKLLAETQEELARHAAHREPEAADAWLRRTSEKMASLSRSHPDDKDYVRRAFDSHVALVRLWWAADNREKAMESLQELVTFLDGRAADPACVRAIPDELAALCVALGALAEELGDFEAAGFALGRAEQLGSDTADRRFRIAEACFAAGTRNMDSNTQTAVKLLGMAITHAERLTRDAPDDVRYTQLLAQSLQRAAESAWRTQRWREGADAARRAVEVYRKLPASSSVAREGLAQSLYVLGYGLRVTGHPRNAEPPQREAIACAKALVADFPGNSVYRHILAKSHADMSHALMESEGREDEAAEHHRQSNAQWELITDEPNAPTYYWRDYIDAQLWWGRCLRRRQPAEAATAYAATISAASAGYERFKHIDEFRDLHAECLLEAGNVYREGGEPAKALDSFSRAVQLQPGEPDACDALSAMLTDGPDETQRDPKRATDLARSAIERDPRNGKYRGTLGAAMLRAGDPKAAVTELTESLKQSNASGRELLYLAMAHWQLGETDKARKIFDQAVAWIEKNASGDQTLARIRAEAAKLLGIPSPNPPSKTEPAPRICRLRRGCPLDFWRILISGRQ